MRDYSSNTNLSDVIDITMDKVKSLMETNTIVGEPMYFGSTVIIPISKVSIGFVVGGGEYSDKSSRRVATHYPMAGGSGGGISLSPVGFLVSTDGDIKYIDVEDKNAYQATLNILNKAVSMIPSFLNKTSNKEGNNANTKNT